MSEYVLHPATTSCLHLDWPLARPSLHWSSLTLAHLSMCPSSYLSIDHCVCRGLWVSQESSLKLSVKLKWLKSKSKSLPRFYFQGLCTNPAWAGFYTEIEIAITEARCYAIYMITLSESNASI